MNKSFTIHKFNQDNSISKFIKVRLVESVEIIENREFKSHGTIVRTGNEGNGFHGYCSNCGLALVTDLGYNSWENTECKVDYKEVKKTEIIISWTKDINRASKLTLPTACNIRNDLITEQGWGEFNFLIKDHT